MHWQQLLTIIGCLSVIVGSGLVWIWSRMNKKFDQMDKRIHKIHIQLSVLKVQVVKLKTQSEERTLRVIHVNKSSGKRRSESFSPKDLEFHSFRSIHLSHEQRVVQFCQLFLYSGNSHVSTQWRIPSFPTRSGKRMPLR